MNDSTELGKYKQKLMDTKESIDRLSKLIKDGQKDPDFIRGYLLILSERLNETTDNRDGM